MNILIVANHYPVASGRYAAAAFKRLGHTVWTTGPAMGREIWGMTVPPSQVWRPDSMPYEARDSLDLVVVMDSDPAILDEARGWQTRGWQRKGLTKCVVWGVDNHVRDYRRPWFDHYFLAHKLVSVMDWRPDMTWLPCAYDETVFTPGLPWMDRPIDVALIGVLYPARRQAIQELKEAGLKVVAGMGLFGSDCAGVYQHAKISLCLSAAHDVSQRVFETAATGCVVLSDPLPDLEWLMLPGVAIWDGEDLTGSVQGILADPQTAIQWTTLLQSAVAGQSWTDRARTLLTTLEAQK